MFEKLISALPFNPSLGQQLSFYAKRLRDEQRVRRTGLIFLVMAFLIQFFAFISPPVPTLAASPNDLVNGGFSSAAEAASDCRSNLSDYGTILAYYGITCDKVASASTLTINSDDWNKQLWSMGRLPYDLAGETPITIPGLGYPLYDRYLWGWDQSGTSSNYQVLNVTTAGGQTFLLMYACGNLASVGFPQPVVKSPNLTIAKTTVPGSPAANTTVTPGTTVNYRIYFSNSGGPASNVLISDQNPIDTTAVSQTSSGSNSHSFTNSEASWEFSSLPGGTTNDYVDVGYQINNGTPNGTQICNVASIKSSETASLNSNSVCLNVQATAPPPTPTPTPPAPPTTTTTTTTTPTTTTTATTTPSSPSAPQPSCEQQLSSEDQSACVSIKKSASNLTENISNANGTTAHAGDVIEYTLSATNNGSSQVNSYVFSDSLAYVLDYSKMTEAGSGTLDSSNDISWPPVTIQPGQTVSKQFEVEVDNPIPNTPASTSDPNYFNLTMSNTFGNTITISLPATVVAAIKTTSSSLPNTGPGNSILIAAVVIALAGFFFYRSRLLNIESKIALQEQGGGV